MSAPREPEDEDPQVIKVARAIAEQGFGRPWNDFLPVNAHDTDQGDLIEYARAAVAALRQPAAPGGEPPFQKRVLEWLMACFSMEICRDGVERNHRFLEEALELVQALGCTRSESHQLVDYVFDRPMGEPDQELGGVQVTLAALCFPNGLDMAGAAERELARVWTKIDKIRAKQAAKPKHSPLPASPAPQGGEREDRLRTAFQAVDDLDWKHLLSFIPESGHGQFWKSVFEEVRGALKSDRPFPAATADARKALSNAIDSLTVQELSEVFGGNRKTPLSRSYSEQIVDIIAPKLEAALTDKRPPMQEDGK